MTVNRQFTLAARPAGYPTETDFNLVEAAVPTPAAGEVLLRTLFLSVDPYQRMAMSGAGSGPFNLPIGQVVFGATVCEVAESHHPAFQNGDVVLARTGWQEYAVSDGTGLRKFDPALAPVSTALGVLGGTGLTAYFGLLEIGQPKPGDTVVVSGAAGAVGCVAGQIAKIMGCRVVGIAGTDAKVDFLTHELGFDAAFNYKTTSDYVARLRELCPRGADIYFDNVGGAITDAVYQVLSPGARVAVCGQISQYNAMQPEAGPRLPELVQAKELRVERFNLGLFGDRLEAGTRQLAEWLREGKLKSVEDVVAGFENTPKAFIGMLKGENIGKRIVKVADR
ncbi:MAG TPA: NADP-dependent oxidoreductase [Symbiobacteriaceae bacterium]|jgi:hypothetical protein